MIDWTLFIFAMLNIFFVGKYIFGTINMTDQPVSIGLTFLVYCDQKSLATLGKGDTLIFSI